MREGLIGVIMAVIISDTPASIEDDVLHRAVPTVFLLLNRWYSVKIFFIPPSCACISFFLAELNFSKTSILSAPGSIFHQTISPSTSRSLIPSVTQLDISIFLDISRHAHALHSIHRYICTYLWHWRDTRNVIYFHIKISLLNYIHYN